MPGHNPYRQVLLTYWRRPAFRALIACMLIDGMLWFAFSILGDRIHAPRIDPWGVLGGILFFLEGMAVFSPVVLLIAFVAMVIQHLREQMTNPAFDLLPRFRRPHLLVGAAVFLAMPLVVITMLFVAGRIAVTVHTTAYTRYQRETLADTVSISLGMLAIVLSLMTLTAAWAALHKPWASLLILPLLVLAFFSDGFARSLDWIINDLHRQSWGSRVFSQLQIILLNLLILLVVGLKLARRRTSESGRSRSTAGSVPAPESVSVGGLHRPLVTPLSRAWHRRHGVLDPSAPWAVGIILAVLLMVATLLGHRQSDLLRSILLPTVVPGVVISLIWRERWGNLGYESLYPARRADFVSELAVATAIQLAELWLATALAAIVPIAVWEPSLLASPIVCAALLASAAMQFMVFGVMFVAALFRATLLYVNLLTILAALIPITFAWADKPLLSPRGLLFVAIVQMACGIALTVLGSMAWRRRDLA